MNIYFAYVYMCIQYVQSQSAHMPDQTQGEPPISLVPLNSHRWDNINIDDYIIDTDVMSCMHMPHHLDGCYRVHIDDLTSVEMV